MNSLGLFVIELALKGLEAFLEALLGSLDLFVNDGCDGFRWGMLFSSE